MAVARSSSAFSFARALSIPLQVLEFLKCRNNDDIDRIKARLQDVLNREAIRVTKRVTFIERYMSGESSLHIHARIRMAEGKGASNFCAVIKGSERRGISSDFRMTYTGTEKIQTAVFINVRELSQETQPAVSNSGGIVRLQTLDECKGAYGNPRQQLREGFMAERDRGAQTLLGSLSFSGKATLSQSTTEGSRLLSVTRPNAKWSSADRI